MPARNANRGRGGGRGKAGNRPSSSGGGEANARAASTSQRGGSGGSATARGGESGGGRATSGTARDTQTSRTASGANASSGRAGGGAASSGRTGGVASGGRGAERGAATPSSSGLRGTATQSSNAGTRGARRAAGVSSGIGGGDAAFAGIATSGGASQSVPRAADVDAALFGGGPAAETPRTSERQRDLESVRETRETRAAPAPTTGGTPAGTGVAGRPQTGRGLPAWLAGAENPFAMMRRMQEDLETVFRAIGIPRFAAHLTPPRELEELLARTPALGQTAQWSPQIEVFEREGNLVVHADLPGVKRDDVEVNVNDDVLTIRGQRRQENREAEGGYRRTERSYGTFFRQILLPGGVDPTEIEAAYENGVLEVVVPSPRSQQTRRRVDIR